MQVPRFFRSVYFENKQPIGKVDEIFGPIENYLFSVNLEEGVAPKSVFQIKYHQFKTDQTIYMDPYDCMPMDRFLPRPKGAPGISRGGAGGAPRGRGGRGGGRGGPPRGGFGRGAPRGGPRGGGFNRGGAPRGGGFGRGGFKR